MSANTLSLIIFSARIQTALPVCWPPPRLNLFTIQFPTLGNISHIGLKVVFLSLTSMG